MKYLLIIIVLMFFFPVLCFAEEGEALYKLYCSQCHGIKGSGQGINSDSMYVNPQNHTDPSYMSSRSDKQLKEVIKLGGIGISKSPVMPPWGQTLSDNDIKALVKYLRKLCNCEYTSTLSSLKLRSIDPEFKE